MCEPWYPVVRHIARPSWRVKCSTWFTLSCTNFACRLLIFWEVLKVPLFLSLTYEAIPISGKWHLCVNSPEVITTKTHSVIGLEIIFKCLLLRDSTLVAELAYLSFSTRQKMIDILFFELQIQSLHIRVLYSKAFLKRKF